MSSRADGAPDHRRAVSRETAPPEAPAEAVEFFGDRLGLAQAYVARLASAGIERGLLGPREVPRLWERHVLNCAVVADLIRVGERVADVGSGAGLPGVALALARPDLEITLIEPLLRRATFLRETVDELGLSSVTVQRARAEEIRDGGGYDVVTARAVAPLEKLAGWTLPLLRPGGRLLALKGASIADELAASAASLTRSGASSWTVEEAGSGVVDPPTLVAVVIRATGSAPPTRPPGRRRRKA